MPTTRTRPLRSSSARSTVKPKVERVLMKKQDRFVLLVLLSSIIGLSSLLLIATVPGYSSYRRMVRRPLTEMELSNPTLLAQRVAKHFKVSMDEVPNVAIVQDADILRQGNPAFYKDAQNGDRVLLWSDKLVLYSPSQDLILNAQLMVQPVQATTTDSVATSTQATSTSEVVETPSIEVRNGSGIAGLAGQIVTRLRSRSLDTLPASNALIRTVYPNTLIFVRDANAQYPKTLTLLQEELGGRIVTSLPGETDLQGDVVIIVGRDVKR